MSEPTLPPRPEQAEDIQAIYDLTKAAFAPMPYSDGDEQDVVNRLRAANALTLSLVSTDAAGRLVGQVTFSPAVLSDGSGPWFALGPVSVDPACQSTGIGSQLIEAGLDELAKHNALGCILTGNPAYYQRFGFERAPNNAPDNEPAEYFQLKRLGIGANPIVGRFTFHPAFYGPVS